MIRAFFALITILCFIGLAAAGCIDPADGAPTVTSPNSQASPWGTTSDTYTLTFSEDVFNVDTTSVTWTPVTGTGTLDSITAVSGSETCGAVLCYQ